MPVAEELARKTGADAPAAREIFGVKKLDVPPPVSVGRRMVVDRPVALVVPVMDLLMPIFSMVTFTISALLLPTRISCS